MVASYVFTSPVVYFSLHRPPKAYALDVSQRTLEMQRYLVIDQWIACQRISVNNRAQ